MKYVLPILLVFVLIGAGCTKAPEPEISINSGDVDVEYKGEQKAELDENGIPVTSVILGDQPDVTVEMTINNSAFSPNSFTTKPKEKIAITFTQVTGTHTFTLDETRTNVELTEPRTVYLIAPSEPGSYTFSSTAGPTGTLIVE